MVFVDSNFDIAEWSRTAVDCFGKKMVGANSQDESENLSGEEDESETNLVTSCQVLKKLQIQSFELFWQF